MKQARLLGILAALFVWALVANPPNARADMLSYVNEHGINIGTFVLNPGLLQGMGDGMCRALHSGEWTPQQIIDGTPALFGDAVGILATAQHEICPDTLR